MGSYISSNKKPFSFTNEGYSLLASFQCAPQKFAANIPEIDDACRVTIERNRLPICVGYFDKSIPMIDKKDLSEIIAGIRGDAYLNAARKVARVADDGLGPTNTSLKMYDMDNNIIYDKPLFDTQLGKFLTAIVSHQQACV